MPESAELTDSVIGTDEAQEVSTAVPTKNEDTATRQYLPMSDRYAVLLNVLCVVQSEE